VLEEAGPTEVSVSMRNATESERTRASRQELAEHIVRHCTADGIVEVMPGLSVYRASAPMGPICRLSAPSFCVIAQGRKEVQLGNERYRYDASQYLLVSAGVPLVSHIVEASHARPFLGVRVVLDPAVITAMLVEAHHLVSRTTCVVRAVAVSTITASLLDAVVRLVRLVDTPVDYRVLGALTVREIVYHLLAGPQGERLRRIALVGGREHRIAEAISRIRKDFDQPLRIADLADALGMSVSGLHHHFKAVTAMSPLQFQKQLRLQEARRLLVSCDVDAANAGFRVGYDDPSHFSREYKRFFGAPPKRDTERRRVPSRELDI
jgi:AraC-like DNA-binding protein